MYEVEDRVLREQPTLVMRGKVAVQEMPEFLGKAYGAVETRAAEAGVAFAGPPFARYRALDERYEEFDVEAGFPLMTAVEGDEHVASSVLPAGKGAATWHVGPYDELGPAYEAVMKWIIEKNGTPIGDAWETYHSDPMVEPDPQRWRTEVIQPYL